MAAMRPLGTRKEEFRESFTSTIRAYRRDLSGGAVLRIAGARFLVIETTQDDGATARSGLGTVILAVQPQWSFPAAAWIDADPQFWDCSFIAEHWADKPDAWPPTR